MTPTDAARAAAEKFLGPAPPDAAKRNLSQADWFLECVTPLLAERDATIDAMEKTVVELQRQVDELKREYSELEAAIERHY